MARAQNKPSANPQERATVRAPDASLPAVLGSLASATRLKQAPESADAGLEVIEESLKAALQDLDDLELALPSRLGIESLVPELPATISLAPLADKPQAEERRDVYRVVRKLGVGGMATVYEAVKEGVDGFRKRIALKRIHDHLAQDSRIIELLVDEARLASMIDHPNVCQVFDFGVDASGHFMALEYLDGFTLRDVFGALQADPQRVREPLHARVVARIIAGLAEGLHAAHELTDEEGQPLDVVHRDVTPHNLFVLRSGNVKVADFGVARARNQLHHTATGALKGKLAYSSPEQLHRSQFDRQTDVFGLGVVFWEMLTGQRLFDAESESATILRICNEQAPDVRTRQNGVAPSIAAIVRKALAIDPAQRFKTTREMSSAIERALSVQGDSVPVTDVSEWLFELMGSPMEASRPELARLLEPTRSGSAIELEHFNAPPQKSKRRLPPIPDGVPPLPPLKPPPSAKQKAAALVDAPTPSPVAAVDPRLVTTVLSKVTTASDAEKTVAPTRSLGWIAGAALALALLCGGGWLALKKPAPEAKPVVVAPAAPAAPAPVTPVVAAAPAAAATTVVAPSAPPEAVAEEAPPAAPAAKAASVARAAKPSVVEPAPAEPAPSAAPSFGTLLVSVSGGEADVLVDGRNFGPAPQRIALPVGQHTVAIAVAGRGMPSATAVQIDAGASSFVTLTVPAARN